MDWSSQLELISVTGSRDRGGGASGSPEQCGEGCGEQDRKCCIQDYAGPTSDGCQQAELARVQEVDQKMSITSDMVKANVLEMRRHKDSVSSQLSG